MFKNIDNIIDFRHHSSSKKRHHVSQSSIIHLHSKPFDLYSSYRQPNDPIPNSELENLNFKFKKRAKRPKKFKKAKIINDRQYSGGKHLFNIISL